jgi:hypothetical protein
MVDVIHGWMAQGRESPDPTWYRVRGEDGYFEPVSFADDMTHCRERELDFVCLAWSEGLRAVERLDNFIERGFLLVDRP